MIFNKSEFDIESSIYYLVDPINKPQTGITVYVNHCLTLLKESGVNADCILIEINEPLNSFKTRVAALIEDSAKKYSTVFIECPETYAASELIYLHQNIILHIRLHFSKVMGEYILGHPDPNLIYKEEQKQLNRASIISTASYISEKFTRQFFNLGEVFIWENPIIPESFKTNGKYDIGYVGKLNRLKGSELLFKVMKSNPYLTFIICTNDVKDQLSKFNNVTLISPEYSSEVYSQAKVVFIPSLFESASMVAMEALSANCFVATWGWTGCTEYKHIKGIFLIPSFLVSDINNVLDKACCAWNKNVKNLIDISVNNSSYVTSVKNLIEGHYVSSSFIEKGPQYKEVTHWMSKTRLMQMATKSTLKGRITNMYLSIREYIAHIYDLLGGLIKYKGGK